MTSKMDRARPAQLPPRAGKNVDDSSGQPARRRVKAERLEHSFRAKPFVLGLSYGFALGFVLEAILASHP